MELEALRAQLEGEQLHCQELQRLWAAERRELQEAAQRERQLLADRLHCAWEKQQAQEEQQLKEWEQRQRATETQQLLRWKEAELHATQELLERECDVAQHVARKLQQLLAGVLRSPHKNSRVACTMLSDILSKLAWAMDTPARGKPQNELLPGQRGGPPPCRAGLQSTACEGHSHPGARDGQGRPGAPRQHKQRALLLQRALSNLERQCQALPAENHLLREGRSPEACEEQQRLQQAAAKLKVLSNCLEEKCTQLQEIVQKQRPHRNPKQECSNPQEELEESERRLMAVCSLHSRGRTSPLIRRFLARHSYNPLEGPNEDPENELPLTAGQYVYIFGDVDEDGWFLGELTDGTRGLVPSNLVEEVSDDDLDTTMPPELRDLLLDTDDEERLGSRSGGRE
ncbi:peripheral-type benzodiazepine receptor-associated protein 1-like [Lagopus leucura]|uniref:peripheral-type benzodiazepine receptor-associated protein 1-like n=1 Tax=Lagopus leucura TaxID=30410 RepID=UPI001C66F782|nr:peripheral-type benzodiazepine receptor-associated protein 1-like [Lagopus leucura]